MKMIMNVTFIEYNFQNLLLSERISHLNTNSFCRCSVYSLIAHEQVISRNQVTEEYIKHNRELFITLREDAHV